MPSAPCARDSVALERAADTQGGHVLLSSPLHTSTHQNARCGLLSACRQHGRLQTAWLHRSTRHSVFRALGLDLAAVAVSGNDGFSRDRLNYPAPVALFAEPCSWKRTRTGGSTHAKGVPGERMQRCQHGGEAPTRRASTQRA